MRPSRFGVEKIFICNFLRLNWFREWGGLDGKNSGILDGNLLSISPDGQGVGKFGQGRERGRQGSRKVSHFQHLQLHPAPSSSGV